MANVKNKSDFFNIEQKDHYYFNAFDKVDDFETADIITSVDNMS